jgi:hypothetical protein
MRGLSHKHLRNFRRDTFTSPLGPWNMSDSDNTAEPGSISDKDYGYGSDFLFGNNIYFSRLSFKSSFLRL